MTKLLGKLDFKYPVYGIQSQALDPGQPALTRLEEIAAHQLREIRKIMPCGPYCFIGFSFGGMVAFEMAQQLVAEGEEAPFVAMIDSCEMSYMKRHSRNARTAMKAIRISSRLRARLSEAFQHNNSVAYVKEKITAKLMRVFYSILSRCGIPIPRSFRAAYHVNWFAARNYTPGYYAGRIVLFKANDHSWPEELPFDLGWGVLIKSVEIIQIPGDHVSLFDEPSVSVLGDQIAEVLGHSRLLQNC